MSNVVLPTFHDILRETVSKMVQCQRVNNCDANTVIFPKSWGKIVIPESQSCTRQEERLDGMTRCNGLTVLFSAELDAGNELKVGRVI